MAALCHGETVMIVHKPLFLLSAFFITAGIALTVPFGMSFQEQQSALAASSASLNAPARSAASKATASGIPRHISVVALGINTSVDDGMYDTHTGQWTLSEESAYYATPTDPVNANSGSTLIYGHNSNKIFGKLMHIQANTEAVVHTDNGYEFIYTYKGTAPLRPTDTSVLHYSGKPRLVLQTCSGLWNQNRQMFFFDLKSYRKL
jgi:hypothetical protein